MESAIKKASDPASKRGRSEWSKYPTVVARVPDDVIAALKAEAQRQDRSYAYLVRQALVLYLSDFGKRERAAA
jgi:Ribbon-helix-helix protein, copG family